MSVRRRAPALAFCVLLVISCVNSQLLPDVNSTSLINSLFLEHLEHTLDRLTALGQVATLLSGGMAGTLNQGLAG